MPDSGTPDRSRRHDVPMKNALLRLTAAVLALAALVFPGFGVPDLLVTWDRGWQVVLEAGWGLFMTALVAGPLLTIAVAPGRSAPAAVQLWVVSGSLLVASALEADPRAAALGAGLALCVGAVTLPGAVRPRLSREVRLHLPVLLVATLGAVPWLRYAAGQVAADRRGRHGGDGADITVGVDHHAVQAALAIALVLLPLLAALWEPGRRYVATCVAGASAYLALVAWAHPGTPAAIPPPWAALALAWSVALAVTGWSSRSRRLVDVPDPS